jgi:AcrR family transcriptional regulator
MAAPRTGTRERLLDAAEKLFAERGFAATSTRDIVERSGDTIGSVNYHFGSKEQLLVEVVRRRWDTIAADRDRAFAAALEKLGGDRLLEATVSSIVVPFLERAMCDSAEWSSYIHLLSQMIHSRPLYDLALAEISEPAARRYIARLQAALPGASKADAAYAYHFLIGAMIHCAADVELRRLNRVTDDECQAENFEEVSRRLVTFVTAGIRAMAGRSG